MPIKIAIFASGSGTNAENLAQYFKHNPLVSVEAVFSNNPKAGVIDKMKKYDVPVYLFTKQEFEEGIIVHKLNNLHIDYVVLAGFLWLLPPHFISAFPQKIINIHPSLLPKYGGKGMYGQYVHKAVIQNNEIKSGISIHLVSEIYDEGPIIAQFETTVTPDDTAESLAQKIHALEHLHFPKVLADFFAGNIAIP
jgi:phosphoribosylglycinamide formyltransferase 1